MDSLFYFDTEDSISPPEHGNDDVILEIIRVLEQHGVRGSFHIIGDKLRCLEQRRRHDILDALQRHDVSSHYNRGSVHPTTTAQVLGCDWDEGVRVALACEEPGFADFHRILGRCAGLTRHGGSFTPQTAHAVGRCGKVFYGVPFHPPGARAFWFARTLCFTGAGLVFGADGHAGPGCLEGVYVDEAACAAKLAQLKPILPQVMAQWDYTALFGAHPLRMNTTEYACWNHYGGVNRPQPLPPPLRPDADRAAIRRSFTTLVAYLGSVPELHFLGLDGLQQRYGKIRHWLTGAELDAYAHTVLAGDDIPGHDDFSPAELLVALAQAVVQHQQHGSWPTRLACPAVIGPKRLPRPGATLALPARVAPTTAAALLAFVQREQALPAELSLDGLALTPGEVLDLLARYTLARTAGDLPEQHWTLTARPAFPRFAEAWPAQVLDLRQWRVFAPDIDFTPAADLSCAQAWSVKPAHPR